MDKRIAQVGVGAVGSYIGGFISRAGYDITLIDMWPAHVERMKEHGLHISGPQGDFTVPVKAVHWTDAQQIRDPFDIIFLSVKSYDTEWAAHFAKRFLAPNGIMVSAQNCMNDHLIASVVGYNREVACVVSGISVALWEPGHVQRRRDPTGPEHKVFRVGELHGKITPRIKELAELLGSVDGTYPTTNVWGERWAKLAVNAAANPVIAMTGLGSQGVARTPSARRVHIHLAKETAQVGLALNYDVEPVSGVAADVWARADEGDVFEELDARLLPRPDREDWKNSMIQDVLKGRKTEIDQMNGYIVERGREVGIPTPFNAAVVEVVKSIQAGRLSPDPSNAARVLQMVGL